MKNLAAMVVELAAFLELSGDDSIDPDAAVSALEALGSRLQQVTEPERDALHDATREAIRSELASPVPRAEALRFYAHFLQNFGLDEYIEASDHAPALPSAPASVSEDED